MKKAVYTTGDLSDWIRCDFKTPKSKYFPRHDGLKTIAYVLVGNIARPVEIFYMPSGVYE